MATRKSSTKKSSPAKAKPAARKAQPKVKGRTPSGGHHYYLVQLLGRVDFAEAEGFAVPQTADEADAQIRTMAGVAPKASTSQSRTKILKLLGAKVGTKAGTANAPISDQRILATAAKKVA